MNQKDINACLKANIDNKDLKTVLIALGSFLFSNHSLMEIEDEIFIEIMELLEVFLEEDLNEINHKTTIH